MSATDLEKLLPKHKLVKVAAVKKVAAQRQRKCEDMLISEEDFNGANFDPFAEENREFAREFYSSNHYRLKMPFMRAATEEKEAAGADNDGSAAAQDAATAGAAGADAVGADAAGVGAVTKDMLHSNVGSSDVVSDSATTAQQQEPNPQAQDSAVSPELTPPSDGYYVADEDLSPDSESALPPNEREWNGTGKWYTPEEKAQVQPERQLFTPVKKVAVHRGEQESASVSAKPAHATPSAAGAVDSITNITNSDHKEEVPWSKRSLQEKEDALRERITQSLGAGISQLRVEDLASEFALPKELVVAILNYYLAPVASSSLSAAATTFADSSALEENNSSYRSREEALPHSAANGDCQGNASYFSPITEDDSDAALRQLSAELYAPETQSTYLPQSTVATVDTAKSSDHHHHHHHYHCEKRAPHAVAWPDDKDSARVALLLVQDLAMMQVAVQEAAAVAAAADSVARDAEAVSEAVAASSVSVAPDNTDPKVALAAPQSSPAVDDLFAATPDNNTTDSKQQYAAAVSAPDVSAIPELLPPLPTTQSTKPRMSWQERDQLITYNDQGEVLDMSLDAIMAAVED